MGDERTDEQLMTRTGEGDLDAFGILVERHHKRVLNLAYRLSGDPELSRDIAQESFLRILKGARRYEARARFSTFLHTVVRNLVIEMVRKRRRRHEATISGVVDPSNGSPENSVRVDGAAVPPDVMLERKEIRQRLQSALATLPDDLRDAFVLTEIEGLSYRDVAEICDCPEGTVASRKHHAVEQLRRILTPYDQEKEQR